MLKDEIIQIIQDWAEDNLQLVRCDNVIQLGYDKKVPIYYGGTAYEFTVISEVKLNEIP